MSIKILAPVKNYLKIFNSVDDFNSFYATHKSEIDEQSTYMLNKLYLVEGHRITKIRGELMLKKYDPKTDKRYLSKQDQLDRENDVFAEFRAELDAQAEDIRTIRESVNKIIKYLNPDADAT